MVLNGKQAINLSNRKDCMIPKTVGPKITLGHRTELRKGTLRFVGVR